MMKKLLCGFIFSGSLSAYSQNPVPNPGLEAWVDFGPYEDPQWWGSLNEFTWPFGGVSVKKDSGTHSGVLAVKLISIGHNNTTLPGVMCTGTLTFSNASCKGGFPATLPFANFAGFYKYLPEPGDSCLLYAMLTKWNTVNSKRDTVAVAVFSAQPVANYTFFSIPFHYYSAQVPDSGQIILSSTIYLLAAIDGSVLIIDDLAFTGIVGIDEITSVPVKIYPDPANEFLHCQIPPPLHAHDVDVFDCLGRKVQSVSLSASLELISTKQFPEGIFFYKILNGEKREVASGKFMVSH
ncbi:MAG TPA: T9SS type A sorting domain-containing protein [Chitinophagales bacterium]|nr:T9SS type A sorting domain-containing protein [Chitinophagales bacterium]